MIGWLGGTLKARDAEGRLLLAVQGVGYSVSVPLTVGAQHELGATLEVWVHTHVREDELALFGFEDEVQLQTFRALIAVSGVGPKVALGMLSQATPGELAAAVAEGDVARLSRAKGVGKRLAERLAVELKGKLDFVPVVAGEAKLRPKAARKSPKERVWDDLKSALANLQYRPKEIEQALAQVRTESGDATPDFGDALKQALAILRKQ
jgi:Holliday junction DNA helicase RuvA